MQKVAKFHKTHEKSIISDNFGTIDYCDSFRITLSKAHDNKSLDDLTTEFSLPPRWVKSLLAIRNSIVRWFGLKTDGAKNLETADYYPVGSKAGFFTVVSRNENEIVMGEDDKHLKFRTSVLVLPVDEGRVMYSTTIVRFHNTFGRLYFIPVKPFHKLIISRMLRKMAISN